MLAEACSDVEIASRDLLGLVELALQPEDQTRFCRTRASAAGWPFGPAQHRLGPDDIV
jgi:hypothetical protein